MGRTWYGREDVSLEFYGREAGQACICKGRAGGVGYVVSGEPRGRDTSQGRERGKNPNIYGGHTVKNRPTGGVAGELGGVTRSPRLTVPGEGEEAYKIHGRHRERDRRAYTFLSELRSGFYGGFSMVGRKWRCLNSRRAWC